ncbi:MAG: type I-C CRISPR-associated protein Cas7/Csd2 [Acidobacteriaceae bacterium]|nr:type I-C CRISPR-associated protein Cas7/Csd2 [Acidobacteriaceae bacterium]
MSSLSQKIDFAVILRVNHANPNGDPLNGNRPRTDYNGLGEISDVCLKRKLRDRLQESGAAIFVQSDDRKNDEYTSLKDRAQKVLGKAFGGSEMAAKACEIWFDVRAFGQLFPYKNESKGKGKKQDGDEESEGQGGSVSIPVRGPVTVQSAFSVAPVDVTSTQITKSVSGEGDGTKRGSDTMGMKHRVDNAVYVFFGSMNPQLAERTGFSDADAEAIKAQLPRLFENDASSARPEGTMRVLKVFWWKHSSKPGQYSSARVHGTLKVSPDGTYVIENLHGLTPEEIDGF